MGETVLYTVNGRDWQEMTPLSVICTLTQGHTVTHPAVYALQEHKRGNVYISMSEYARDLWIKTKKTVKM